MDKEDLERITKRTVVVLASFTKNYLVAFLKMNVQASIQDAVQKALDDMKDQGMALVKKEKKDEGNKDLVPPEDKGLVTMSVAARAHQWDFDGSAFTGYDLVGAYVHAGKSRLRTTRKRYRLLFRFHEDLEKQAKESKVELNLPKDLKFPPKKLFGNMDSEFLEQRQKGLDVYIRAVAASPGSTLPFFLKSFDLIDDPEGDRNKEAYIGAFYQTCTDYGIWFWDDPKDFEDEGAALTVLMIQICRREFFPEMENKIWNMIKVPALGWRAVLAMRKAASKAVGASVQTAWEGARGSFNKVKKEVQEKFGDLKVQLDDVLGKVVGKIVTAVAAKMPKPSASKDDDAKETKEEKKEGWPGAEKSVFTSKFVHALKNESKAYPEFEALQKEMAGELKIKSKLSRQINKWVKDVPDSYIRHMLWRLQDAIEGTLDLFHSCLTQLLEGMAHFVKLRDEIEAKFVALAGKPADEAKAEAKKELDAASAALAENLKALAVAMGSRIYHHKGQLRWQLRWFNADAANIIFDLITALPEKTLNLLATFRLILINKWATVFDQSTKAEDIRANVRDAFVTLGLGLFDPYFGDIWETMTGTLTDAAKAVAVYQLKELIKDVIAGLLESLQGLVPDALAQLGLDLPSMSDMIVTKMLESAAAHFVVKYQKKLEKTVFAEDEPLSDEEKEAEKARAEKDAKEKAEKEAKDKAYNEPPAAK
jgi:hypothetical protein